MFPRTVSRAAILPFLLCACASEPAPAAEYAPREATPALVAAPAAAPPAPEPPPPVPAAPVQVVAGENTPIEGPAPTLQIRAPKNGQVLKTDKVEVTLALKSWALAPDPGNHVHLIVDNEPYMAIRDASKPIDLRALMQKELGHDLPEGTHVLRAFPSRGHHESVKEPGAFAFVVFHFKKKTAELSFDPKAKLLTYSRPKGCVELGQRALLDFYVANDKLSAQGDRVHVTIDGASGGDMLGWTPHYIENLTEGEHTLHLQLTDANGAPVPGPFNDITRTIKVQTECKKPAAPAAAATPVAAAPTATTATPAGPALPAAAAPTAPASAMPVKN